MSKLISIKVDPATYAILKKMAAANDRSLGKQLKRIVAQSQNGKAAK